LQTHWLAPFLDALETQMSQVVSEEQVRQSDLHLWHDKGLALTCIVPTKQLHSPSALMAAKFGQDLQ
jgi:hypothetical protein